MKLKTFECDSLSGLERNFNTWVADEDIKVQNLQYSSDSLEHGGIVRTNYVLVILYSEVNDNE